MKNLIFASMICTLSFNASADCINAYQVKAEKRAESNSKIKSTAGWVGIGSTVVTPLALASGSIIGGAVAGTLVTGIAAVYQCGDREDNCYRLFKPTEKNTYYKVLRAIEAAEAGEVSKELRSALDKKISLESFSDEERKIMEAKIVKFIANENNNNNLCKKQDRKFELLNFRGFVDKVVEQI